MQRSPPDPRAAAPHGATHDDERAAPAGIHRLEPAAGSGHEPTAASATSHRVARNGVFYLASLGLPALAALVLVPITIAALGPERFGLLALAWAVAEGSSMFDLGLGRATVRFVADGMARDAARVEEIVLASVYSQSAAGALAGLALFGLAPALVRSVFDVSPTLRAEGIAAFRVLALHVPVLLALAALRSSLEGAQRFDVSTALRLPSSLASLAIPAVVALRGGSLATILWLLLGVRVTLLALSALAVRRTLLTGPWRAPAGSAALRDMLSYSGWVAVSAAVGPALASFDRFVVGTVAGVGALGYYTGAAEAANRFLLLPATAFAALLPALAAAGVAEGMDRALAVTRSAARQLTAVLFPLCLALGAFAPAILGAWLGEAFARESGTALRILSLGVFLTGIAHLPMALLYGSGRSDLPAKIHLFQFCVHLPLTYVLVRQWGISGAALAWTVRCAEDLVLYEWARRRALGRYPADATERGRFVALLVGAAGLFAATVGAGWVSRQSTGAALALVALALAAYAWGAWTRVLSPAERRAWRSMLPRLAARDGRRASPDGAA